MFPSFDKLTVAEIDQNTARLAAVGVRYPEDAVEILMRIRQTFLESIKSGGAPVSEAGDPEWFRILIRVLEEAPRIDAVITAVDRFIARHRSAADAFAVFEHTPRSMEILSRLACGSPFLTQTVLSQPDVLEDLTTVRRTAETKAREQFVDEAMMVVSESTKLVEQLGILRRFQRREILRIGMCDAFGLLDLKVVTLQLSLLADAMVQVCLSLVCHDAGCEIPGFSILALGKHGGEELNYSSDIDLVLVGRDVSQHEQRIARQLIDALCENHSSGFLYRVDMRLRPWGDAGLLVTTVDAYADYLNCHAELWERQALLKARVIGGDHSPGTEFLNRLPSVLFTAGQEEVFDRVRRMKSQIEQRLRQAGKLHSEVKLGAGSIRDIEFLVQALQLTHGKTEPRVASANTLDALVRLAEFGMLNAMEYRQLREGYIFLRTVEHALQLLHNQQTHELPADPDQRRWLARRLDYPGEAALLARFEEHRRSVRSIFERYLFPVDLDSEASPPKPDGRAGESASVESESGDSSALIILKKQLDPELRQALSAVLDEPVTRDVIHRVTGCSRHLWESILQGQSSEFLNLLSHLPDLQRRIPDAELREDLFQLLRSGGAARDIDRAERILNEFKDRRLLRSDLRHLLGYCGEFGSFSDEITGLAEVVVTTASHLAYTSLIQQSGVPMTSGGYVCRWALVALGKFGGREMGVASDLELLLVYEDDGTTEDSGGMSCAVFFERLVNQLPVLINARQKGIFDVDLRMRPYGQAGSAAISLHRLQAYFGPTGDAWPYERQSLVKARSVGGDPAFGTDVERRLSELLYSSSHFDFVAMRAMREKQIRQLVHGGTINAKLSDGGLVDCEYAVQALQLTFGHRIPELRTQNTLKALQAAHDAALLTAEQFQQTAQAYRFLRELIDCLRMDRGNALDLTVPPLASTEYRQLAARMQAVHDSPVSLGDLDRQMNNVRMFAGQVEQICRLEVESPKPRVQR
ncbi:MAG: hypothetical protein R3C49_14400 [Planctomycetaceae bacterium]